MKQIFTTALVLSRMIAYAQTEEDFYKRVGINTTQPRAGLEVKAYTFDGRAQGILFPHISEAEKSIWTTDELKGLVKGTVIWNTTKNCLDYFNGTTWQCTDGTKKNTHPTTWFDVDILELTAGAFSGRYKDGVTFTSANTVKFKLKNNGTEAISNLNLTNAVTIANGTATITATGENANAVNIPVGGEIEVTYTLSGKPEGDTLTATFSYENKTATANTTVAEATPTYPPTGMGTLTISASNHTIFSLYDNNYFPYTAPAPTAVASWDTNVAPSGDTTNEVLLDKQGTIPAAGKEIKIPISYTGSATTLEAFTFKAVAIDPKGEQGVSASTRKLILSWEAQPLTSTTRFITAKLTPSDGQDLHVTKLDLNSGLGGELKGPKLAEFSLPKSNTDMETKVAYTIRVIPGIPDKNFGDGKHDFIYFIVVAEDGKVWLNNNLGADYAKVPSSSTPNPNFDPAQQATAYNDYKAYGSLFQWQRKPDDHELITWIYKNNNYDSSIKSTPVAGPLGNSDWIATHSNFIKGDAANKYSWVDATTSSASTNKNLWQANQPNNPCPTGFHVPTLSEWNNLHVNSEKTKGYIYWSTQNSLHLPAAGQRRNSVGSLDNQGEDGQYWSSSSSDNVASFLWIRSTISFVSEYGQAFGFSVRCIAD